MDVTFNEIIQDMLQDWADQADDTNTFYAIELLVLDRDLDVKHLVVMPWMTASEHSAHTMKTAIRSTKAGHRVANGYILKQLGKGDWHVAGVRIVKMTKVPF